jgi:RecA/RadA recombinase
MRGLSTIAERYNIAVAVTNQINFTNHSGAGNPSGGSIMAHGSTYRISLKRLHGSSNHIAAKIVSSPYHHENIIPVMIIEKGIDDVI